MRKDLPRCPACNEAVVPLHPLIDAFLSFPDESARHVSESGADSLNRHRPSAPHECGHLPGELVLRVQRLHRSSSVVLSASIVMVFAPTLSAGKFETFQERQAVAERIAVRVCDLCRHERGIDDKHLIFERTPLILQLLPFVVMTAFLPLARSATRE
jgi:hypothetical protein